MNRHQRRASEKVARMNRADVWTDFKDMTKEQKYNHLKTNNKPATYDAAYANNRYTVYVYLNQSEKGKLCHAIAILRNDKLPNVRLWDINKIKNEIIGEEAELVAFIPANFKGEESPVSWFYLFEDTNKEVFDMMASESVVTASEAEMPAPFNKEPEVKPE